MTREVTKIKSFRDLEVWKLGMDMVADIYAITKLFPKDEMYGLVSQMRRAAVSIPSNIAEGFNRHHNKEYIQFLNIALGSCAELETQIEVCGLLCYINNEWKMKFIDKLDHESRMIKKLTKCLKM